MLDGVPLLAGSVDIKDYFEAIAVTLLGGIVNLAAAVFIFNKVNVHIPFKISLFKNIHNYIKVIVSLFF